MASFWYQPASPEKLLFVGLRHSQREVSPIIGFCTTKALFSIDIQRIKKEEELVKFVTNRITMKTNWRKHISSDPKVMLGKPVIKGTRICVELILEKLAEGEELKQILESHPTISRKDVFACMSFAVDSVKNETTYSLA